MNPHSSYRTTGTTLDEAGGANKDKRSGQIFKRLNELSKLLRVVVLVNRIFSLGTAGGGMHLETR